MPSVLAALLLAAAPAAAQEPAAVAERYIAATRGGEWEAAAELMHPVALAELQELFAGVAAADTAGVLLPSLFGVATATELRMLRPAEAYARLLRSFGARWPQVAEAMRGVETEVLGTVHEEPDLAHVVYRMRTRVEGEPLRRVEVISLRRSGDRWLVLLAADLNAVAQTLSRAVRPP